jgi:hypothetical protein
MRKFNFPTRGENGRIITVGLFIETRPNDRGEAVFTLHAEDRDGVPSLLRIYREYNDPTEYQFAMDVFGEYRIWKAISENHKIKPYVDSWREELEAKIRAKAIAQLTKQAEGNPTASRWLAEGNWNKKKSGPKTKAEAEKEERVSSGVKEHLKEHLARLRQTSK